MIKELKRRITMPLSREGRTGKRVRISQRVVRESESVGKGNLVVLTGRAEGSDVRDKP